MFCMMYLSVTLMVLFPILPLIKVIDAFSTTRSIRYPIPGAICTFDRGNCRPHSVRNRTVQHFLLGNNLEATLHRRYSSQLCFSSNSSTKEVDQYNGVDTVEQLDQLQDTIEKLRIDVVMASQRASMAEETVEILQQMIREAEADLRVKDEFWEEEKNKLLERISDEREQQLMEAITMWRDSLTREQQKLEEQRDGTLYLKERLLEAENQLEFEQMRFHKETVGLTERITGDMTKLTQLEEDKAALERKTKDQQSKLILVEYMLESETNAFEDEKRRLEDKVEENRKSLNLKRSQMYKRYQRVRKDAWGLMDMEKKDARNERVRLKKTIVDKRNLAESLQQELETADAAFQQRDQLQEKLARQTEELAAERSKIKGKFSEKLRGPNEVIKELNRKNSMKEEDLRLNKLQIKEVLDEANLVRKEVSSLLALETNDATAKVVNLSSSIMILEKNLRERDMEILSYESSYREMVKLSVKLTGRRIRNAGSKVGSLIRKLTTTK